MGVAEAARVMFAGKTRSAPFCDVYQEKTSKNHLFLEKKWFYQEKTSKNHFFLEKKMVLPGEDLQKPSFSREKDGFTRRRPPKTIFFSRKRWFEPKKPSFSRENQKTIFWRPQPHSFGKDGFFFFFVFLVCCFLLVSCLLLFP